MRRRFHKDSMLCHSSGNCELVFNLQGQLGCVISIQYKQIVHFVVKGDHHIHFINGIVVLIIVVVVG